MRLLDHTFLLRFIVLASLLSSCATVLNRSFQRITISHDDKSRIVSIVKADSSMVKKINEDEYCIERSKAPAYLTLQSDNVVKQVRMPSENSFAYYYNILANYGLGMLIDRNSPKRFGIQRYNYFTLTNDSVIATSYAVAGKGSIFFDISLPVSVNIFNVRSSFGNYKSGGPLMLAAGIDFFKKNDEFFSARLGVSTDQFAEHPGKGYYQTNSVVYLNAQKHFIKEKFDFGYGMSLSRYTWENITLADTTKKDLIKRNVTAGLSLSLSYRIGKKWFLEGLYQPGVFVFGSSSPWFYQHYISISLIRRSLLRK